MRTSPHILQRNVSMLVGLRWNISVVPVTFARPEWPPSSSFHFLDTEVGVSIIMLVAACWEWKNWAWHDRLGYAMGLLMTMTTTLITTCVIYSCTTSEGTLLMTDVHRWRTMMTSGFLWAMSKGWSLTVAQRVFGAGQVRECLLHGYHTSVTVNQSLLSACGNNELPLDGELYHVRDGPWGTLFPMVRCFELYLATHLIFLQNRYDPSKWPNNEEQSSSLEQSTKTQETWTSTFNRICQAIAIFISSKKLRQ